MKGRGALLALSLVMLVAAKPPMRYQPDPSSVIAAEIAFNRLAQQKGQWTAFRETAADDAVMFVPQRVVAKDWLKKQADPPASVSWSPSIVYVSCDGLLAASTGIVVAKCAASGVTLVTASNSPHAIASSIEAKRLGMP